MEPPFIPQTHDPLLMNETPFNDLPSSHRQSLVSTKSPCNLSKSQLALALVIQRSKPDGLSTSDYCRQLKAHVNTNKPSASGSERFVDTVEFWKDQYARLHRDTKILEDKVRYLEMQQRAQESCDDDDDDLSSQEIPQRLHVDERRACTREVNQACLLRSRKQESSEPVGKSKSLGCEHEAYFRTLADDTRLRLLGYAIRIARQRTNLEQMLPVANSLEDIEQLAQSSCETVQVLDEMLSHCCVPLRHIHWNQEGNAIQTVLERLIAQAGVAFLTCFKALTDLCQTILGRAKRDMLVYQMVMIFHKALNLLRDLEGVRVDAETILTERNPCNQRHAPVNPEYAVSKYLAEMLASVAYALDWRVHQYGHRELLEGILFSILERTGYLISKAVFTEHVANSRNPGNITCSSPDHTSSWVVNPETRYIVRILHATLGGSDKRDSVVQFLAASESATEVQASCGTSIEFPEHKTDFVARAKTKIQNTLIKSCVGVSTLETVKLPLAPSPGSSAPTIDGTAQESYGPDWFIETVWAMIGWDTLGTF